MNMFTWWGFAISRYGLVFILLLFGAFKFTPTEAAAIKPLLEHSPLLNWLLTLLGKTGASQLIGVVEIVTAMAIAARSLSAWFTYYGSLMGALMFVSTLSFIITTPGMISHVDGFWIPDGFLIKDLLLLGFCLLSAGEARAALVTRHLVE